MKHFLTKLIENAVDESTHRRFIKFSKGDFPNGGPVVSIKASMKKNLTINGSFEYEDLIGFFIASNLPDASYRIGGNIYTQPRVTLESIESILYKLSLIDGWEKGKRDLKKLQVHPMNLTLSPKELVKIYDNLSDDCYLFLTINPEKGKEWAFKSEDKIPSLKKTFGKADPYEECKPDKRMKCDNAELCRKTGICITERTKFCRVKTGSLDAFEELFELFLPDFPELNRSFNNMLIINQYIINDIIFPDDKESYTPQELRGKIKKAGFLERIIHIDGEIHTNKTEFVV